MTEIRDVIIIGGGPAGYTAALYAARGNLRPLVFEGFAYGGQLMITSDVENYPGFEEGIMGPELMATMRKQAERFGAEEHQARSVIVATGATARQIGLPSERQLQGMGVSYCAVCDAAFFRDKHVIVVGGGDSAMEETSFLAKFASDVKLVHRRDEFRASKIMIDYARSKPNVEFITNAVVDEVLGTDDQKVTGVRLKDTVNGETRELPADGLFVAIGHDPTTGLFRGILDMDEAGYLITKDGSTATNIEGVFAAGDVVDHTYRQAVTAAGMGCMAALDAERWLAHAQPAETPAAASNVA
jgi:thioredoxin reductase (NADPH)